MAGKGNTFETDLLALIFNGTAIANVAQNGTSPLTELYVSLHSAEPGEAGTQQTNELQTSAYDTYAREAVPRTSATPGWAITSPGGVGTVKPTAAIEFNACTGGTGVTATHFAIGTALSGAGKILYFGGITPNIPIANGTTPRLTDQTTITED